MRVFQRIVQSACIAALLLAPAAPVLAQIVATDIPVETSGPPAVREETSFRVTGRYTAQRRPRVTVLDFQDTNSEAQSARYGASVQAMLVTFLKRKSQLVVVERQKLGDVVAEWQRNQRGMTNLMPEDPTARELLEKLDGIIIGNVTLLNIWTEANVARKPESGNDAGAKPSVGGPRIEIDAKLLSRADGRIIAAAQRRGPVACLRSIVERLGIALEQEFLRPYYGRLNVNLKEPENVRIFLTPILLDTALDEEKPPVEHSSTVIIGGDRDIIEPWTTDPTTYTIENLLSGWYSMRLERPGYEGLGTERARWSTRDNFGQIEVYDQTNGMPLEGATWKEQRFVVRVDPLSTETINGDSLDFNFRKMGGSLSFRVKRQYLDKDYQEPPDRVILIGHQGLEINQPQGVYEYADDEQCDLFDERAPHLSDYGRTYVAAGQDFDFETYKGGKLVIEDYQGGTVPVGLYQMAVWEPLYQRQDGDLTVRDGDQVKAIRTALVRETQSLKLMATGAKPKHDLVLEAKETGHRMKLPLNFDDPVTRSGLPVDSYTATTNIPGFANWRRMFSLEPVSLTAPIFDPQKDEEQERMRRAGSTDPMPLPIKSSSDETKEAPVETLTVKTRLSVGGRLEVLSQAPDVTADDLYVDRSLLQIMNLLLYGRLERPAQKEERSKALEVTGKIAARVGQGAASVISAAEPSAPASQAAAPEEASEDPAARREPYEELLAEMERHLEHTDLLILDGLDMDGLRKRSDVAALIRKYVAGGGTLFAFITENGDYAEIVGAPFVTATGEKETDRFILVQGEVPGLALQTGKKIQVQEERTLPELQALPKNSSWRVAAFGKGRKAPRIIERASDQKSGSVVIWLDDPASFKGRKGGTVQEIEAVRKKLEEYLLKQTRSLLEQRFGGAGQQAQAVAGN